MPLSDELRAKLRTYPKELYDAIHAKDLDATRAAIAAGAFVNWAPPDAPLEDRPEQGDPEYRVLAEARGAAVSPLAFAVRKASLPLVNALLEAGADPKEPGSARGWTSPVQECVSAPTGPRLKILARLLAAGAPAGRPGPLPSEEIDREPLWTAVNTRKPSAEAVRMLLDAGADPNLGYPCPVYGYVSVLRRAKESSPEIADLLRSRGARED